MPGLSADARVILLLTAPLPVKEGTAAPPLTPSEYRRIAVILRDLGRRPGDLLSPGSATVWEACETVVGFERLDNLLMRDKALGSVIGRWGAAGVVPVTRADPGYPAVIKRRLGQDAPAVLWTTGDRSLLSRLPADSLAVVGPRRASDDALRFARETGALCARAGIAVVSGGARGVDSAAMQGALDAGGTAFGILPDSLARRANEGGNRALMREGRLALLSPFEPFSTFRAWQAMQRNRLIYACTRAALVADAALRQGGTWAGASEELARSSGVPVWVRDLHGSAGLEGLKAMGAHAWPEPRTPEELRAVIAADPRRDEALF